jgi:hypothetical protein
MSSGKLLYSLMHMLATFLPYIALVTRGLYSRSMILFLVCLCIISPRVWKSLSRVLTKIHASLMYKQGNYLSVPYESYDGLRILCGNLYSEATKKLLCKIMLI